MLLTSIPRGFIWNGCLHLKERGPVSAAVLQQCIIFPDLIRMNDADSFQHVSLSEIKRIFEWKRRSETLTVTIIDSGLTWHSSLYLPLSSAKLWIASLVLRWKCVLTERALGLLPKGLAKEQLPSKRLLSTPTPVGNSPPSLTQIWDCCYLTSFCRFYFSTLVKK